MEKTIKIIKKNESFYPDYNDMIEYIANYDIIKIEKDAAIALFKDMNVLECPNCYFIDKNTIIFLGIKIEIIENGKNN